MLISSHKYLRRIFSAGVSSLYLSLCLAGSWGEEGRETRATSIPAERSAGRECGRRVRWLPPIGVTAGPRQCRSRIPVRCHSAPRPGRPGEAEAAPRPRWVRGAGRSGCRRPPCPGPARSRGILLVPLLPASLKALLINEEKHLPFVW